MANTLAEIAMSLNIAKSSVQNRIPQIFLCGGPLPKPGEAPASLRAVLMELLEKNYTGLRSNILLAEDAADWYHNPKSPKPPRFPNLVNLEEQIGALSTLILLIVESAGSIAELGAFSFIASLRAKLSVVLETSYQNERSFIMDGPVAMLERESEVDGGASRWYAFDWLMDTKETTINALDARKVADKIVKEILDPAIKKLNDSELFRAGKIEHQILLVGDLVSAGGPFLISEIMELLEGLSLKTEKKIEVQKVEEYLFLLENLGFLSKTRAGNNYFYVPPERDREFISYISTNGKPYRRMDLREDLRAARKKLPDDDYDRKLAFRNAKKRAKR
jgi:hypothetical protein